MARVLIIEDEAVLRSAMARGIAKMPGIVVADAATLAAALESIDAQAPQMIISDIDLPDRSGLELFGELGRRGLHVPILFVSAYLKAYAAQIPRHADVDVREKPVRLDELRAIIENRLAASSASAAEEAPFAPADYLQLACLGHRSVVIEVETAEEKGLIIVNEGSLWTSTDKRGSGEEAFRRLAFLPGAQVRVRGIREDPGPRTIRGSWEQVLMNAAREHDEAAHHPGDREALDALPVDEILTERAPVPESPRWPPPRPPAPTLPSAVLADLLGGEEEEEPVAPPSSVDPDLEAFEAAFDEGVDALLVKDYPGAYGAFERAGAFRPDDPKVVTNLQRLRQLGFGPDPGGADRGAVSGPRSAEKDP
jgi:DNA-binding response OmpR family regulator